ncbi:hypothetical protein NUW58_g10453 [Xylaria curta]|uniref:Uncharacterized protein n=1 Tax=Xylaria curta TaxID=42375 RepID=A0ACC1MKR8_9PEZI|nr:hypothetical protein NUW58_g10453 [Xylaria curta]
MTMSGWGAFSRAFTTYCSLLPDRYLEAGSPGGIQPGAPASTALATNKILWGCLFNTQHIYTGNSPSTSCHGTGSLFRRRRCTPHPTLLSVGTPIANSTIPQVFESLLKKEARSVEQRAALERTHSHENESEQRIAQLLSHNQTLPVTLSSIQIHGARNTRKSFLHPLFKPLVDDSRNVNYTLAGLMNEVGSAVARLQKFDIFHPDVVVHLSQPPRLDPSTSPTDLDVSLRVREKSRLMLKTGTDLGNTEGSAYGTMLLRNVFGGAEFLSVNASAGTRTRSAYSAEFSTPINSNPDLRLSIDGLASSTHKPWASHEELLKGGGLRLNWAKENGDRFQVGYSGTWRQLTGLATTASPTVRGDAGDSWLYDENDH